MMQATIPLSATRLATTYLPGLPRLSVRPQLLTRV
jgi:hypothetical protein